MEEIKLTQYSHGAGCGCKISPKVLDRILQSQTTYAQFKNLLVGNDSRDDAAVYELDNNKALISTTDFFMPIVDDPFTFGKIAGANAISDIYAMGGKPLMALAILGWPVNKLAPEIAGQVVEGGKAICAEAGIPLAGGHSIDSPEPIFGLSVNGLVEKNCLKTNNTAREGDLLFLTKALGVGVLTTAEKKGLLEAEHQHLAAKQMMQLNNIGERFGKIEGIHAMTDVTGFGLLGHLIEMAAGSNLSAEVFFDQVPLITKAIKDYIQNGAVPGGTLRNWDSYGEKVSTIEEMQKLILSDPQTSGGLLIAVKEAAKEEIIDLLEETGLSRFTQPIGQLKAESEKVVYIN